MRNQDIKAVAEKAARDAEVHWQHCLEFGLQDHTPDAHADVDRTVAAYFQRLQMMPDPAPRSMILGEIETLFSRLDEIKARFGSGLLETDEREIFVTAIIAAAEIAGLDLTQFQHRDPTLRFRNF